MNPQTPALKTPTLSQIICSGWKKLALADQTDADEVVKTLREVLEDLERLDAAHGQHN